MIQKEFEERTGIRLTAEGREVILRKMGNDKADGERSVILKYAGPTVVCLSQLSRGLRKRVACYYWTHSVEKECQSDGQTYTEALAAALRSGNSDIQSNILCHLVYAYRQICRECMVHGVGNTRSLADVLRYLASCGLAPDAQTVNRARNILRKRRFPKA